MLVDPADFAPQTPLRFIALEGVNGAGKSTLAKNLKNYFEKQGVDVVLTFEPGATPLGKTIRKIILERKEGEISDLAEVFLFAADRAEHVKKIITPALRRRALVISDRYLYSSIAFQGYGRGIAKDLIEKVMEYAVSGVYPDITILLDLDPQTGIERNKACKGSSTRDSFEAEELDFHEKIRAGFLSIARERPEPFLVIDASFPPEEILKRALECLQRYERV